MAVPSSRPKLKTAFKNARSIAPLHTSGPVAILQDGIKIVTCVAEDVLMTDVSNGTEICRFAGDTQSATSFCVSPSSTHLLVFTSSLSLRIFEIPGTSFPLTGPVQPVRVVARAHDAPVHVCKSDPTSTYLASGSADGVVKVWNIMHGYVTHVFKGHGGVVSALTFNYPRDPSKVIQDQKMQLITASVDTRIRIFDLSISAGGTRGLKPEAVLEGHVSVPRGLDVSPDGKWLISGGRDSVVLVWDLLSTPPKGSKNKGKEKVSHPTLVKTIPVLERVEAVGLVHSDQGFANSTSVSDGITFYTGGENGVVKIWDGREGNVLYTLVRGKNDLPDEQEEQRQIVDILYLPLTSTIISVHADQNILFYSLSSRSLTRQLIGFNDEIVDATFLSSKSLTESLQKDTHLALATNSSLIRVYSTSTLDARLLTGHTDIVLSLDHSGDGLILSSGSKDRSARIWARSKIMSDHVGDDWGYECVAICEGHAESVGAVAMSRKTGNEGDENKTVHARFMFTGSQDRTIKMWDLSGVLLSSGREEDDERDIVRCKSLATQKAHEKDINSLDVAPNDRLLVSGSQDRTAKIYEIEYTIGMKGKSVQGGLKLLGTCKGHKRGVWCVKFGRTERVLATGSGDKTVKLWSLDDFSCVKTFEGHTNSVLRVDFLNMGMQLVSAASDGLVKLWNVREEQCVTTMDNHQDKVWALAVSSDERIIVSGAADSIVTFWKDCTEEREREKEAKRVDMVQKEQDFLNYLSVNNYRKAIQLALAMEQPGRLLSLFKDISVSSSESAPDSSLTGRHSMDEVIRTLEGSDLVKLLGYVKDWNTNAKTSGIAQRVLFTIVKLRSADEVMKAFEDGARIAFTSGEELSETTKSAGSTGRTALKELVDALIPYTERHWLRMERLVQESYMVDYVLSEMDDGMFDGELRDYDVDGMDLDTEKNL